jgi:hypothetical protein
MRGFGILRRTDRRRKGFTRAPVAEMLEMRRLLDASAPVDCDAADNSAEAGAASGTAVGITASSSDPAGSAVTYSLADDAGGRFAINPSTGVVTVANSTLLAGPATHTIVVEASDAGGGVATSWFIIAVGNAATAPLETDRTRVAIARTSDGYLTLHSDLGSPFRGGIAFVYETGRRTGKTAYINDPAYYEAMRANGLNAVRLIAFDPYQRSRDHNHTDLDNPAEVAALLTDFDTVVNLASAAGLYVIINYHDVGGYDEAYLKKFWDLVAPRYRRRTHVAYELMNEPVKWFPRDYKDEHLADIQGLHERVRGLAPETHQILLTFANTASYDGISMRDVAERLSATGNGINWDNASVGFHPYQTAKSSAPIVELARRFPAINTEQNLPGNEGCVAMDGEEFGVQTMERLGLSWCHWQVHGPERFETNYLGLVLPDATARGYLWQFDAVPEPDPLEPVQAP